LIPSGFNKGEIMSKGVSGKLPYKAPETRPEPRKLEEIQHEYAQNCQKTGELQYQVFALNKEINRLNDIQASLNYEAAERNKLDKAVKDAAAVPAPESTAQASV
jgi:hypothetical protein